MSQSEFAAAIRNAGNALGKPNGCTKRLVQKWESGEHAVCRPNYRRALERVTRKPYAELGFEDSANGSPPGMTVADLRGAAEILHQTAPLSGDASELLRYALTPPEEATSEAVRIVAERTAQLFALESHTPARIVLPMAERHIRDVAAMLAGTRHKQLRRRLATVSGQTAALAGWLTLDLGDTSTAHRYWDVAMACARHAASRSLLACVLIHLSCATAERGNHGSAWQLAHTAISHAGNSPRARAWAAVRAAQEAAQLGDTAAALAELKPALDLAKQLDPAAPEDDAEPWCRFVDRAYIHAMAANVYGQLGDTSSAEAAAARTLDTLSPSQTKTRALVLAETAQALGASGDTARAAQLSAESTALADKLEYTLIRRQPCTLPS